MQSDAEKRLLAEIKYLKGLIVRKENAASKQHEPPATAAVVRRAPKGPSRTWRNPALAAAPPPAPAAPVAAPKILLNPNFKGGKILVNPNFAAPKKILVNPAFQQPKAIHVNPEIMGKPPPPKPYSPAVIFKSKNKLILKKQLLPSPSRPKKSPLIFKSKNKLVRRTTARKPAPSRLTSPRQMDRRKSKQGKLTVIGGENFVSNGGTRLTRLQSIKRRSISVLANRKRASLLPCTIFRKLGHCPRGAACEREHVPPTTLALFKNRSTVPKKQQQQEKKETRYYQSEEQAESKAMRPQRNKTVDKMDPNNTEKAEFEIMP